MTVQILDIYQGNKFDADQEKATGTNAVLIKGGQGEYQDYDAHKCNYIDECVRVGLPWGIFWQQDARYSPEGHKAALKAFFDKHSFGQLGLYLACEKPYYPLTDGNYDKMPFAYYEPVESVWRGLTAYTGKVPGIYSSPAMWKLIFSACPLALQQEFAAKANLWAAQYDVSKPDQIGQWVKWYFWQYEAEPDYSIFNDTDTVFDSLYGGVIATPTPIPAPAPIPEPEPIPAPVTDPVLAYGRLKYFPRSINTVATAVLQNAPKGTNKGDAYLYPIPWVKQCAKLNTPQAQAKLFQPSAFLVNTSKQGPNGEPTAELIGCEGNIVAWKVTENNHYQIQSFLRDENPSAIAGMDQITWQEYAHLVMKWVTISPKGVRTKIAAGLDVYSFILSDNYEVWVDASEVEPFPALPFTGRVTCFPSLKVHASYNTSSPQTGSYIITQSFIVTEYRCRGAQVWGKTVKGWMLLEDNVIFYTTWRVATLPPLP